MIRRFVFPAVSVAALAAAAASTLAAFASRQELQAVYDGDAKRLAAQEAADQTADGLFKQLTDPDEYLGFLPASVQGVIDDVVKAYEREGKLDGAKRPEINLAAKIAYLRAARGTIDMIKAVKGPDAIPADAMLGGMIDIEGRGDIEELRSWAVENYNRSGEVTPIAEIDREIKLAHGRSAMTALAFLEKAEKYPNFSEYYNVPGIGRLVRQIMGDVAASDIPMTEQLLQRIADATEHAFTRASAECFSDDARDKWEFSVPPARGNGVVNGRLIRFDCTPK